MSTGKDEPSSQSSNSYSNEFKRNRTLVGTTSSRIETVNAIHDNESDRLNTHRLSIQRRKVTSVLLATFVSIAIIVLLVINLTATVSVSVSDGSLSKTIESKRYEKVINDYLDINPMSRLSFILNQSDLTSYVSSKLPEVSIVRHRGMVGIGRTDFVISMRSPVAGWQINDKQYYVDSQGVPFEINYFNTPTVQIIDKSGATLPNGSTAIASKRFLGFVGRVVYYAKLNGYTVTKASLPLNTTRELEINLKEVGYYIKLSIDRPAGEQVEDMIKSIRYFTSRAAPQYIDVRVSGKAFYK